MMETPEQFGIKDSERTRCEIWTRVMGYHRPISSFNIGKQGEAAERRYFSEKKNVDPHRNQWSFCYQGLKDTIIERMTRVSRVP